MKKFIIIFILMTCNFAYAGNHSDMLSEYKYSEFYGKIFDIKVFANGWTTEKYFVDVTIKRIEENFIILKNKSGKIIAISTTLHIILIEKRNRKDIIQND